MPLPSLRYVFSNSFSCLTDWCGLFFFSIPFSFSLSLALFVHLSFDIFVEIYTSNLVFSYRIQPIHYPPDRFTYIHSHWHISYSNRSHRQFVIQSDWRYLKRNRSYALGFDWYHLRFKRSMPRINAALSNAQFQIEWNTSTSYNNSIFIR